MAEQRWQFNSEHVAHEIGVLTAFTVLIAAIIALSYQIGLAVDEVVAVWPAAGIAVWLTLTYGWKAIPAVFVSHLAFSAIRTGSLETIYIAASCANALGCYAAATGFKKAGGSRRPFDNVRQVILFVGIVAVGMSVVAAALGVGALLLLRGLPVTAIPETMWRWFFSDFSGIVLVAPLLYSLHPEPRAGIVAVFDEIQQQIGKLLPATSVVLAVLYVTTSLMPDGYKQYPATLLMAPLCLWLSTRQGARGSLFLLSASAVLGFGFTLVSISMNDYSVFFTLQLLAVVIVSASLVSYAGGREREELLTMLRKEREKLELAVEQRTSKLREQAFTDELTGLSNRRRFEEILERVFARPAHTRHDTFLLMMDLDQFKIVNDTSGHAAGDALLSKVAELLQKNTRDGDLVCRLGGDEFAVLLDTCTRSTALDIAEAIRSDIAGLRFQWQHETYRIGVSIGIASLDRKVESVKAATTLADTACYAAKNNGRNRIEIAENDDRLVENERGQVRWAQRLTEAMDKDQFTLYTQTIIPVSETPDMPEHVEVLVRLRDHQKKRIVPPGAYMAAAERYGLAIQLDEWIIRSLLRTLFVHHSFSARERSYWVNLSGSSVGNDRFVDFLIKAMEDSPVEQGLINFEITETAVIRNMSEATRLMGKLRDMGCKFALDDFGTGVSSFSHLKQLPVDYLKIDGMFISNLAKDPTDRIFVKSIIDVAHAMQIKVVAEHVEDDEIASILREMGADFLQGYSIRKPQLLTPEFNVNDMLKRMA